MSDPLPGTPEWEQIEEQRKKWQEQIDKTIEDWLKKLPPILTPSEPTTADLAAKIDACCATIGEIHTIVLSIERQLTQLSMQLNEEQ